MSARESPELMRIADALEDVTDALRALIRAVSELERQTAALELIADRLEGIRLSSHRPR
jgi:hypothetical protein